MGQFVILYPPPLAGTVLRLHPGRQLIGRGSRADLHLDDRHLSALHAAISNVDGRVTVEDLGSSNGTLIRGERIRGIRTLHHGDVVTFGNIEARFDQAPASGTALLSRDDLKRHPPNHVSFDVDRQTAHQINNVGRDQYISYTQQRESFLREVAASRTKARFVFWIGLLLTCAGGLGYAYFLVTAMGELNTSLQSGTEPAGFPIFGPDTSLGIPAGLIFFMIAFVGNLMFFVGLIMWIAAAARARKVDTDPRHAWNSPFVR